jgi:hypothetical protein
MDDVADLEPLAVRLEQSGEYRVLRRVPVVTRYADDDPTCLSSSRSLGPFLSACFGRCVERAGATCSAIDGSARGCC